jgi:FAD synthase
MEKVHRESETPYRLFHGKRGTFHGNEPQGLDMHLIRQKDIDLYRQELEVFFQDYICSDPVVDDPEKFKEQIRQDPAVIRKLLS